MATNSFKYGDKTVTFTKKTVTTTTATLSDGTVIPFVGSASSAVTSAKVSEAYVKLKGAYVPPVTVPTPPVQIPTPPVIIIPPSPGTAKEISLSDFAQLRDVADMKFALKPGSWSGGVYISNLKNVTIEGAGKAQLTEDGIELSGKLSGLVLSGLNLKNIEGRQIVAVGVDKVKYTGKAGTFIDGLTLQNLISDNCGRLFHADGNLNNGVYDGVIKDFRLLNSALTNSPEPGDYVYLGNAIDALVQGNRFDRINTRFSNPDKPNGEHNGIIFMKGNGIISDNICTNHQGNFGRIWLHSIDGLKTVQILRNFVYNSLKYSAFELQRSVESVARGYKPANAIVNGNIAGHLSALKDWDGQLLDLYNTGGTLEYMGNKGFDLYGTKFPISNMINNMSDVKITEKDNQYFATLAAALAGIPTLKALMA